MNLPGALVTTTRPADDPGLPPWIAQAALLVGVAATGVAASIDVFYGIVVATCVAFTTSMLLWRTATLIALVAVVPFTSGLARGGVVPVLKVSEAIIFLGATLALVLRPRLQHKPWTTLDYVFATYAGVALIFGGVHMAANPGSLTADLRVVLQPMMLFLLYRAVATTVTTEGQLNLALKVFLLLSSLGAAFGVMQFLDVPGIRDALIALTGGGGLLAQTGGLDVARATGLFPIWHSLAGYLLVPTLMCVALLLDRERSAYFSKRFVSLVLAANLAGIIVSLTITIGLAVLAGSIVLGAIYKQTGRVIVGIIVCALLAMVLFGPALMHRYELQYGPEAQSATPQTIEYRVEIWNRYFLPVLEPSLLSGYGNRLPDTVEFAHSENQYFTATLRGGITLAALFVAVMGAGAVSMWRNRGAVDGSRRCVMAVTAVVSLAFLPLGMVWPYFANAGLAQSWCAVAGLAVGALTIKRNPIERTNPGGHRLRRRARTRVPVMR